MLSLLAKTLQDEIGWTNIEYSDITSAFTAAYALGMLGSGRLLDKYGARIGYGLAVTVWSLADKDSQWFSPSDSAFMINYRVDDLDALLAQLRAAGVEPVGGPESHENGKFAWIMDPDGNKVELWEPMAWDEKNKGA